MSAKDNRYFRTSTKRDQEIRKDFKEEVRLNLGLLNWVEIVQANRRERGIPKR